VFEAAGGYAVSTKTSATCTNGSTKRELRLESAQESHGNRGFRANRSGKKPDFHPAGDFYSNLCRKKPFFDLAKENLAYYDHLLDVNRERYKAGAIAQVDLDRLELQRVTYESDLQTAEVNLRTAKIQLLMLLDDRTPWSNSTSPGRSIFLRKLFRWTRFARARWDNRPDLKAALQAVDKARTDHQLAVANGSTDPTFGAWYTYNPSFNNPFDHQTVGASVSIPLRIFDRNQGEKKRTELDIGRNERLTEATRAQVFGDVDSAYATVSSTADAAAAVQKIAICNKPRGYGRTIAFFLTARRRVPARFSECAGRYTAASR